MKEERLGWPPPVTLRGDVVTVEPLRPAHHDALVEVVRDGELWKLWYTKVPAPPDVRAEIKRRLGLLSQGSMLPFVVIENKSGRVVGATSYMHIDAENRRLEIGSTFYAASVQRTAVNTECKLLLLTHAFEALGCIAVEFRTHWFNHASRAAIARLGAKQDGVLRNHHLLPDGTKRDTVVFSIIDCEWPVVKRHLQYLLEKPR